jgi:hypothetical protein
MKPATTRLFAILLLSFFFFGLWGYIGVFKLEQYKVKKEIKKALKNSIPSEELTRLSFASSDLKKIHWIKKEKEFIFRNQMFDVVRKEQAGDSIVFMCINDVQEKELYTKLEELMNKQNDKPKDNSGNTIKTTDLRLYCSEHSAFNFLPQTVSQILFSPLTPSLPEGFKAKFIPPPDLSA